MFCSECGEENRNDRKFCSNCGSKLRDLTKPRENLVMPENIEKEQKKVSKRNLINKILNIAMTLFIVAGAVLTTITFFVLRKVQIILIAVAICCYVLVFIINIVKKIINRKRKNST